MSRCVSAAIQKYKAKTLTTKRPTRTSEGRTMQERLSRRWKCTGLSGRSSASCVRGISASDRQGWRKCRRLLGTIPAMHVRTILATPFFFLVGKAFSLPRAS